MRRTRSIIALAAVGALGLGLTVGGTSGASAADTGPALTLNDNGRNLRVIPLGSPGSDRSIGNAKGLTGEDTRLVGIDWRVQDRKYYGVANGGGVYTINATNATLTKVSQLTVGLQGENFGVDFNPAADRLRIVSDTGQNLRHNVNPDGATINDGALSYAPETTATGIVAAAYTNNDLSANSGTVLYDIDTNLLQLAIQVPANAGTLSPIGKLGRSLNGIVGFDIKSVVTSGVTTANTGYVVLRSDSQPVPRLYRIDLTTGRTVKVGNFDYAAADIAIPQ